jgi:hypothetical protein
MPQALVTALQEATASTQHLTHPLSPPPPQVRVVTERAYHALFMYNMLIRPTQDELAEFGEPDFVIYNAGAWFCERCWCRDSQGGGRATSGAAAREPQRCLRLWRCAAAS